MLDTSIVLQYIERLPFLTVKDYEIVSPLPHAFRTAIPCKVQYDSFDTFISDIHSQARTCQCIYNCILKYILLVLWEFRAMYFDHINLLLPFFRSTLFFLPTHFFLSFFFFSPTKVNLYWPNILCYVVNLEIGQLKCVMLLQKADVSFSLS